MLPDGADHGGVDLDIVDGNGAVLQHFSHRPLDPAAQDEDAFGPGVLEGCQVGEVLRLGSLGLEGEGVIHEHRDLLPRAE